MPRDSKKDNHPGNTMANYIDREILCEAYTHLDIETFSTADSRAQLEQQLRSFIQPRAQFIFGQNVDLEISFEDGSLKTKIAILGAVATMISTYPDFKEGVENLTRDATILAQAANLEVVFNTQTNHCDRIRIEKRTGVLGRVNHLLNSAERIRDEAGHERIPTNELDLRRITENVDDLQNWYHEADKLIAKLDGADAKACVAAGLLEELERFPENLAWHAATHQDNFRARVLIEDIELASALDAVAARYARLLAVTKSHLLRHVNAVATRLS